MLNTVLTEWNDREATAVSDVVLLLLRKDGWSIPLVGRYHDVLHNDGGAWRFQHRTATFEPTEERP